MKTYELKSIVIDSIRYTYFYRREKNDRNGNARYRLWFIDPDTAAVYEKVVQCYECQLDEYMKEVLNNVHL